MKATIHPARAGERFMKTTLSRRQFLANRAVGSLGLVAYGAPSASAAPVFAERGYYLLPCRTPTLGYDVYRDLFDTLARDRVNTVILWLGGGFRSKKFPVTWQYNAEHVNVRDDFMRPLARIAQWLSDQWQRENAALLEG